QGRRYNVRVCAKNGNVVADVTAGATGTYYLHTAAAPEVASLAPTDIQGRKVSVGWLSGNGQPGQFKVAFSAAALPAMGCAGGTSSAQAQAVFSSLSPSTTYYARVCAV